MNRDSFIFYRSFAEAIDDLPDSEQLLVYRAIKEYSLNGEEIELSGTAKSFWKLIKPQLKANNSRYENGKKGAEYGKTGGRPPKETPDGIPENPKETPTGLFPKTPNSNVNENVNENGGGENENAEKPPPQILAIKKESAAQGFYIDEAAARKFLACGLDPPWLSAPHSFLEFCAERLREKYPRKKDGELKSLYVKAAASWGDFREEYPPWKAAREKAEKEKERRAAFEKAKRNIPERCRCGGELNGGLVCKSCGGFYLFCGGGLEYKYEPPADEGFIKELRKKLGANGG